MTPLRLYLGLVVFSLAGSLFVRISDLNPGLIAPLASAATLLAGLVAVFQPWLTGNKRFQAVFGAYFLGLGSEVVGIVTGFPFGRYVYTDRWWPTVPLTSDSRIPILLPFAWLLVAGSAFLAAPGKGALKILLGAFLATLVDAAMEPVMTGPLGYWRWTERGPLPGGAPIMNAVGWFGVSALAGWLLYLPDGGASISKNARIVLAAHTTMILALGFIVRG
ncbi:hypothetical protein BH11ARM2_BH11ARM2_29890 [soil metagenome]